MINWDFIKTLEGSIRYGYVPYDPDVDNSGVTIGMGVDLGHRSVPELINSLRLPTYMVAKFKPYVGKKGVEAREVVKESPLVITKSEEELLNKHIAQYFERKLEKRYNKDNPDFKWKWLTDIQQTVIMSVFYQHGHQMFKYNFWRQAIERDWQGMVDNLRSFGDAFSVRRNKEADLLEVSLLY